MKPYQVNFFNGLVLCGMGLWAYLSSENPSFTALIPVIFGLTFLALTGPFRKENKVVAHIIVALTLLIFMALFKPLTSVIGRNDSIGLVRVIIMMGVLLWALVVYVKSFIDARKSR